MLFRALNGVVDQDVVGNIPAPTLEPDLTVTDATPTTFTTGTFTVGAFETAVAAGGKVLFTEAGTYDCSTWTAQTVANALEITNTSNGVVTLDFGTDYGGFPADTSGAGYMLLAGARIILKGLRFTGWKSVIIGARCSGANTFAAGDEQSALDTLCNGDPTPSTYNDGIWINDCTFERCVRVGYISTENGGAIDLSNVYFHNNTVRNCYGGLFLVSSTADTVSLYNNLFEDITTPAVNRSAGKPHRNGFGLCYQILLNVSDPTVPDKATNIYLESNTFDGIWSQGTWNTSDDDSPEVGALRLTGADGAVIRNCIFRNIGKNKAGTQEATLIAQLQAMYFKADNTSIINCLFDHCYGYEGIVTFKGTTYSSNITVTGCEFVNNIRQLLNSDSDGAGTPDTRKTTGLISGSKHFGTSTYTNLIVDGCDVGSAFFAPYFNLGTAAPTTLDVDNITVKDSTAADGCFEFGGQAVTVTGDNILGTGTTSPTLPIFKTATDNTTTFTLTAYQGLAAYSGPGGGPTLEGGTVTGADHTGLAIRGSNRS